MELYITIILIILWTIIAHVIFDYRIASVLSFFVVIVYLVFSPYWKPLGFFEKTVIILLAFFLAYILRDLLINKYIIADINSFLKRLTKLGWFVFIIIFSTVLLLVYIDNITGVESFLYHYFKLKDYSYIWNNYSEISKEYFLKLQQYLLNLTENYWYGFINLYIGKYLKPIELKIASFCLTQTGISLYVQSNIILSTLIMATPIIIGINFLSFYITNILIYIYVGVYIHQFNTYVVFASLIMILLIFYIIKLLFYIIKLLFYIIKQFFFFIKQFFFKK